MTPNDIITWLRDKLPYAPDHAWKNVMEAIIPLLGELESRRRVGAVAVINEEENERLKERIAELEAENRWIPVEEALPETIACAAGTAYSEAVIVWTSGRKAMIAVWDGIDFLCAADYWEAWGETITHWHPLPKLPAEEVHHARKI